MDVVSVQPALAQPSAYLLDDLVIKHNSWKSWNASALSMQWSPLNLTADHGARVDITLWGYWENTDDHVFEQVGLQTYHFHDY